MHSINQKALHAFAAILLLLGLQQFSSNAVADQVVTISVVDGEVSADGDISLKLIETAGDIVDAIIDGVVAGGTYNISSSGSEPIDLVCEAPTDPDYLDCAVNILRNDISFQPLTMHCERDTSSQSGGGICTLTHKTGQIEEMIEGLSIANNNISNIANSFLSCLQGAIGGAEAMCSQLITALGANDDQKVMQIINSLAPLNPEATSDLARDNLRNSTSVVLSRLGQIRTDTTMASNVSTQMFFANNEWLHAGARLAANDSLASDVTPGTVSTSISDFGKLGFFINVNATDGKYKGGSLSSNSDFTSTMLTLGFDYRVRDDLVTGLAFNIGQSKTKYKSTINGKLDAENYSLIVYNSFYKESWYFDSSLTIGGDTYKQNRDPIGFSNSYSAEFHSMQYNLSLAAGYDFYVQGFGLTPFAQIDLGRLHIDGYKEKDNCVGGCGVALAMDKHKRDIGSFNVGGRFRYIFTTSKGVFIPNLTLTAVSDFKNDAQVVTGRFIGLNRASGFEIMSEKSDSDYFIVATGFSMQLKNGNSGFFNLESLQGYDNLDQMRVTLGWRWEL